MGRKPTVGRVSKGGGAGGLGGRGCSGQGPRPDEPCFLASSASETILIHSS